VRSVGIMNFGSFEIERFDTGCYGCVKNDKLDEKNIFWPTS
jgi:hypothetical protein